MALKDDQDPRIARISSAIRVIPDFPKPGIYYFLGLMIHYCLLFYLLRHCLGFHICTRLLILAGIMFQDITTLLLDTKAFKDTIDLFVERYQDKNISVVAGTVVTLYPHFTV